MWKASEVMPAPINRASGLAPRAFACSSVSMMRAMSTRNDEPERASRPFDKDRDGFVFGEAGALMIIETEEHAKARGAKPLARLMGAGITS
ncbi:beta-ketoacyl synthase N-terminal-like domain-containing protein, partial [Mycobacterium asiaticum]|uniref:beta-ketoacyl synthase N-terminal-like domain-containing protein n=1 Tax=Mycobacterium asiaticum TaxID=1790 RepID=UPI003F51498A